MADTKISALTAVTASAAANEFAVNEAGTSKKCSLQQIADFLFTRINGSSGAAGAYKTLQKLSADSADNTTTAPADIMTTTGVGAGTWHFKYVLIYQTAATTTGIALQVDHSGTTGQFTEMWWQCTSGGTAANAIGIHITSAAATLMEGKVSNAKAANGGATIGVVTANTDTQVILEGFIVVTVSGDLKLQMASEVAASAVRVMADSNLELTKIG